MKVDVGVVQQISRDSPLPTGVVTCFELVLVVVTSRAVDQPIRSAAALTVRDAIRFTLAANPTFLQPPTFTFGANCYKLQLLRYWLRWTPLTYRDGSDFIELGRNNVGDLCREGIGCFGGQCKEQRLT